MLNGALVINIINSSFSESKKNYLINREQANRKNIEIWTVKYIFPSDFTEYLS